MNIRLCTSYSTNPRRNQYIWVEKGVTRAMIISWWHDKWDNEKYGCGHINWYPRWVNRPFGKFANTRGSYMLRTMLNTPFLVLAKGEETLQCGQEMTS